MSKDKEMIKSIYLDDPFIVSMLEPFVVNLPENFTQISKAMNKCRWNLVSNIAHQQRGVAATFGFPTLAEVYRKMEIAAKNDVVSLEEMTDYEKALEKIIKNISPGLH